MLSNMAHAPRPSDLANAHLIADVQSATHALDALNSGAGQMLDPRIRTLVVLDDDQIHHVALHVDRTGRWGTGLRFQGVMTEHMPRVFVTRVEWTPMHTQKRPAVVVPRHQKTASQPISAEQALLAYKHHFPKARGMSDEAILAYIETIKTAYATKKSSKVKVAKINTILAACRSAGLMSVNRQGKPAPFYQRGGRKNYRSMALDAIFHWVTGLAPKKKHNHDQELREKRKRADRSDSECSSDGTESPVSTLPMATPLTTTNTTTTDSGSSNNSATNSCSTAPPLPLQHQQHQQHRAQMPPSMQHHQQSFQTPHFMAPQSRPLPLNMNGTGNHHQQQQQHVNNNNNNSPVAIVDQAQVAHRLSSMCKRRRPSVSETTTATTTMASMDLPPQRKFFHFAQPPPSSSPPALLGPMEMNMSAVGVIS